jgi:hypothetical protein
MRRLSLAGLCFLAVLFLLSTPQVRADGTDTFTFSEQVSPGNNLAITWQLPSSPGDISIADPGVGFVLPSVCVTTYLDGSFAGSSVDSLVFLNNDNGGGFLDDTFGLAGVSQLYSGSESWPTFITGTYSGFDALNLDVNGNLIPASLTITAPEPSSLLSLLVGFLAVAVALALRKLQA